MQVEAAPQTKLKNKVETAQTTVTSYQAINTKLAAAETAGKAIGRLETWRTMKTKSSSESVTATSGGLSAMAGNVKFDVKSVARPQTTVLRVDTTADNALPPSFDIKIGKNDGTGVADPSATHTITLSGDPMPTPTPDNLAAAINSADIGIRAYVVKTGENVGMLQLTGAKAGAENGFELVGFEGLGLPDPETGLTTDPATTVASNAVLKMNPDAGSAAYEVTSDSNTFTGLMPGVTVTVSKEENGVTVDATTDVDAIAAKFKAFVDATNEALTEIKTQTAYDPETRKGSPLTGDFTIRQMSQALLSEISTGLTSKKSLDADGKVVSEPFDFGADGPSLSRLGIKIGEGGLLEFKESAFKETYTKDPALAGEAGMAFGSNMGILTNRQQKTVKSVVEGRKTEIETLNDQVSNWDIRLASRRQALQRQYAALETALGKLQNQSSWLSGQLGG
ncbi:flagellar filament capping protein FliD [Actinoplanes utahensis]